METLKNKRKIKYCNKQKMNTDKYYKSNNHIFHSRSSDTNITIKTVPGQNLIIEGTASLTGSALKNNMLLIGNGLNQATQVSLSGDITTNNTGVTTLANTTVTPGVYNAPTDITVDSKGRIISATTTGQILLPTGTASLPSYTFVGNNNTGMYSAAANRIDFTTNGGTRMAIFQASIQPLIPFRCASGTLALPSYSFSSQSSSGMYWKTFGNIELVSAGVCKVGIASAAANTAQVYINKASNSIGACTQEQLGVQVDSGLFGIGVHLVATSGTALAFYTSTNTTLAGSITCNTNTTAYTSVSDHRLKENINPMLNGMTRIMQLKPCYYDWKDGSGSNEGFIAHELQEVVPGAVVGTKDAVDENENPVYQAIDTSFIIASLVSAVQELKREIDTLKTRI